MEYESPTEEMLELWQDLIGVRGGQTSWGSVGAFGHSIDLDTLREAFELDPTEVTATMLLGALARDYFGRSSVTLEKLLDEPDKVATRVGKARRLLALVDRPEIAEQRDRFISGVTQALELYGVGDRADIAALLARTDEMAFLRRDALRSMKNLVVHQFLDGDPEADNVKPVYYRFVHQWWNVNSLLSGAVNMAPGVSLNLVRDPNDFQSYFCFAIRNGGRLFVLSDAPQHPHPLAAMLSRRPDKDLDRRIAQNWFPYDLMGVAYNEENGKLYIDRSETKALAPLQSEALPLSPISKLRPQETVWLAMMFGLIVDRFWRKGFTLPELSYTGEMIKVNDRMIAAAEKSNLPVKDYRTIDVTPLTKSEVGTGAVGVRGTFGERKDMHNVWLEERYGDLVSEESLNVVAAPNRHFTLLPGAEGVEEAGRRHEPSTFFSDRAKQIVTVNVEKLPSTQFGTQAQLEADRMFVARYNYAVQIDALAKNEFNRREKEVRDWYVEKVKANLPVLETWVTEDIVWLEGAEWMSRRSGLGWHPDGANLRSFSALWDWKNDHRRQIGFGSVHLGEWKDDGPRCVVTGGRVSYGYTFAPANPAELALVAGCAVDGLPDVLRHYDLMERHSGNHRLERVDPVEWALDDPWNALDLRVCLMLSKRGLAKVVKQYAPTDYIVENAKKGYESRKWTEF